VGGTVQPSTPEVVTKERPRRSHLGFRMLTRIEAGRAEGMHNSDIGASLSLDPHSP
jgi:hypothetical protein